MRPADLGAGAAGVLIGGVEVRPESVEIKITLAGAQIEAAVDQLGLAGGDAWSVVFCEDVTDAAASTALLDLGVVLRVRGKTERLTVFAVPDPRTLLKAASRSSSAKAAP